MMTVSFIIMRSMPRITREWYTLNERALHDVMAVLGQENRELNESHTSSMTAPPVMAAKEEGDPQ